MDTYYVEVSRHEKNEYHVECEHFADEYYQNGIMPAYQKMVDWMTDQLQQDEKGVIKNMKLKPAETGPITFNDYYGKTGEMNISSVETVRTGNNYRVLFEKELVFAADRPMPDNKPQLPFNAKGYDLFECNYIFATVDSWHTVKPYKAASPEQALQMAKDEELHKVLDKELPIRQFLHAHKYEKVMLPTGQTVDVKDLDDFREVLKKRFPDGLTVRLADESYANLVDFNENVSLFYAQTNSWQGLANPGDATLQAANGNIPAELHLKPEEYRYVFPCEDTYYDEDMLNLFAGDFDLVSSSLLLANEPKLEAMRVNIPKFPVMQDRLFIAGKPFRDVMQMAGKNQVSNEHDFRFMLDKTYLDEQPAWLQKLAEEQTIPERQKFWINNTAQVINAYKKQYNELVKEAVERFGYNPELYVTKEVPRLELEKYLNATDWLNAQTVPLQEKVDEANKLFDQKKVELKADYIRQFRDFARKNVSHISMYLGSGDKWHVRCKINGEQQSGKPIVGMVNPYLKGMTPRAIKEMVYNRYAAEIVKAMDNGIHQVKGFKR